MNAPPVTLAAYSAQIAERLRQARQSPSAERLEAAARRHLVPYFGAGAPLDAIARPAVEAFLVERLTRGYHPGAVGRMLRVLSILCDHAVQDGLLAANPCVTLVTLVRILAQRVVTTGKPPHQPERRGQPVDAAVVAGASGPPEGPPTLGRYAAGWLAQQRARARPATLENYERSLRLHILPGLGSATPLAALTRVRVRDFLLAKAAAGIRPTTVRMYLAVLRGLFNAALDDELVTVNPCDRVGRALPRAVHDLAQRAIPRDEFARFLAALGDHRMKALFVVGARTGMRVGELLGLQWSDVDVATRRVTVRRTYNPAYPGDWSPKGKRIVALPLSREAVRALEWLRGTDRRASPWVFHGPSGRPWSRSQVRLLMRRACRDAGIPHAAPHAMRHQFITDLAEAGVNPWKIRDLARHTSIVVTERYLHLSRADVELVDALDGDADDAPPRPGRGR